MSILLKAISRFFYGLLALAIFIFLSHIAKAEPVNVETVATVAEYATVQLPCKRCKSAVKGSSVGRSYHIGELTNMIPIALSYQDSRNPTGFRGNWCGAFMAMVARKAGYKVPANSNLARSWLKAGYKVEAPQIGVYIISRSHVELYIGNKMSISGNYSNRVGMHPSSHGVYIMPFKQ